MTFIKHFSSVFNKCDIPATFPNPFNVKVHPLAWQAAQQLQQYLASQTDWQHDFWQAKGGKRFAVLVIKDKSNNLGFLSGFNGKLAGQWLLPGFVPPVFDPEDYDILQKEGLARLADCARKLQTLENGDEYQALLNTQQTLKTQRENEIFELKTTHQLRKKQRHAQRKQEYTKTERPQSLARLAHESQQDKLEQQILERKWQNQLSAVEKNIQSSKAEIEKLKQKHMALSQGLAEQLLNTYQISNFLGEKKKLTDLFEIDVIPKNAGDCAAVKLLNFAQLRNLKPVAMAEFWWGAAPEGEIRHHGFNYPASRALCKPLLSFMLQGVNLEQHKIPGFDKHHSDELKTVYEDEDIVVVNKPSGMLSVPGKEIKDSVLSRLQQCYPEATGPLLLHRLDLSTSGLLLAAKNSETHKALQRQFMQRQIEKRYVAVLSGELSNSVYKGVIELPMRVDINDRPRQMVCKQHGKAAISHWEIISVDNGKTRIYFYPLTGRTHQLRVHAAHKDGLNMPIEGDELYGVANKRLLLHAERLSFIHPRANKYMTIDEPAPF